MRIPTIILSGGIGYRLKEETEFKPKPMIEIGGKPILWHIMKIYSHFGFNDFIIALGYKGNLIKDYFVSKKYYDDDFTLNSKTGRIVHHRGAKNDNLHITFVDTGLESLTGERVRRVARYINTDHFMLTYGDGLSDINIKNLVRFALSKKTIGTVSGVYPTMKYGGLTFNKDGIATGFEKRAKVRRTINGGFMIFKKKIFDYIKPDSMIEDVFHDLITQKQLSVYKHAGFFHSMDTLQDVSDLNELWNKNPAWKVWD